MPMKKQIENFLNWYRDLYGRELYIADEKGMSIDGDGEKMEALKTFHLQIKDCQKCPLGKTRTNFVFGVGNPNAAIMFIGEAPGYHEDQQGEPFVGRGGQLLNKLLAGVGLRREDVYIANILKCRPPNNRDPLPEEVVQCIPYLHRQIEMIQPRVLVALGRIAAQNLLQTKESLGNMRRRVWAYQDKPLIVTYHPAYILRNMNMLDAGVEDMKFVLEQFNQTQ